MLEVTWLSIVSLSSSPLSSDMSFVDKAVLVWQVERGPGLKRHSPRRLRGKASLGSLPSCQSSSVNCGRKNCARIILVVTLSGRAPGV